MSAIRKQKLLSSSVG